MKPEFQALLAGSGRVEREEGKGEQAGTEPGWEQQPESSKAA